MTASASSSAKTKTRTHDPGRASSGARRRPTRPFFRSAGSTVADSFFRAGVQAKLRMSRKGDPSERQADEMADAVTSGGLGGGAFADRGLPSLASQISPFVQRQPEEDETALQRQSEEEETVQAQAEEEEETVQAQAEEEEETVQAQAEEEEETVQAQAEEEEETVQAQSEEEEETVQAQADEEEETVQPFRGADRLAPPPPGRVERDLRTARGRGSPLPERVRSKMEDRFGADFSGVRIHTDDVAIQLTSLLRAKAFAHGRDLFFNRGKFSPDSREGEHLLAHELTHTVQQGVAKVREITLDREPAMVQRQEEEEEGTILVRPELLEAIKLARTQIGKVNAKVTSADGTRIGWERLYEYFFTAFGEEEVIHQDVIKYLTKTKTAKGSKDAMPSWCGIFVWWSLKKAGLPIPDWKLGTPILGFARPRKPNELPRKGDIAYKGPAHFDHFALVSGVESPESAEGKSFKSIQVATVNGNTAGDDNLGGQVQEKWEPIGAFLAFFDPVGKLDLPPVPLVKTGVEPDEPAGEVGEEEIAEALGEPTEPAPPTDVSHLEEELPPPAPDLPAAGETDVPVELPPPAAPGPAEEVAEVEEVALEGSSDEAMVGFVEASPSAIAKTQPALGPKLDEKLGEEQQHEAENPPVLVAETSGKVEEGLTPPDQIPVPAGAELTDGVTGADPGALETTPHQNVGETPSNEASEKLLEDKDRDGGLIGWLRNNFRTFLSGVRTRDPGLNTRAGERPNVKLEGEADPGRVDKQRDDARTQIAGQRDQATEAFKNHPGQTNIQAKKIHEERTAGPSPEVGETIETPKDEGVADYANAPLPANVREKADQLLQPDLQAHLGEAKQQTRTAAEKKETDKSAEVSRAESEARKRNEQADKDQRDIVVKNRGEVAARQKKGIEDAYAHVSEFDRDANKEQTAARKEIGDKVKDSEAKAREKLDTAEEDARKKKEEGEQEAAAKKKELEKEQKKESWWDRAVNAIKSAVKALTKAIDAVFTKIRNAVKTIIEAAKNAAIGLINAARDWIVDKLNKFRDWAKGMVDKYLKDRFPGLAAAINAGIDTVVDTAIDGVNAVADAAIAGIEALAAELAKALDKILNAFQTALKAAVQIAGAVLTGDFAEALRIAIQAVCDIAGIDSKPIFDFIDRAAAQITAILKNPRPFFNNVMLAIGTGIRNFVKNIKKHLIGGLIGWLTGAIAEGGITLPEKFDVKGIFSLVMQILGLTYENIKAKVIRKFPPAEKIFAVLEKAFEIVKKLVTEGPMALWEEIKTRLANLKEMVIGGIRDFIITKVIKEGIIWLLSLLNPASAIVKLLKMAFDFVMFLIERINQIKDFVMSVYNSIVAIASGAIGKAAAAVEDALARSVPVVISLLASLLGLGGIGKTIKGIISKVSAPVHKLIDRVIDKIIAFAKKILKKGKAAAAKAKAKLFDWWKAKKRFSTKEGESHTLYFKGKGKGATLMIKSSDKSYAGFVKSIKIDKENTEQVQAKENAGKIAAEIDDLKRRVGLTKTDPKTGVKDQTPEFEQLLGRLARETAIFMLRGDGELPTSTPPVFGPLEHGFASSMKINILTKIGPPGTTVTAANPTMTTLYRRLEPPKMGRGYYIAGHLLNHNLHGPGTTWKNLTPLTQKANREHLHKAEKIIKRGVTKGEVYKYEVSVNYGRSLNSSLLTHFNDPKNPDPLRKKKAEVVEAEQYMPLSMGASWQELDRAGEPKGSPQQARITNTIDERSDVYKLK